MIPGPAILLDGVSRTFGDDIVVDGVSLQLERGLLLGFIGPSGAGKTTTMKMMTGALAPTDGTVRVLGEDPRRFRRSTRERIGYMPQQFSLYEDLTTRENVDFHATLFGMLFPRRLRRIPQVLRLLDLWDARGRRAGQLSGGMQRRLELACALVHDPELLFLDEPTAGIDPLLRERIWQELHRLRDLGRTLVITTQYVTEAEECDQVVLISEGRVIAAGTPDELRRSAVGGQVVVLETAAPVPVGSLVDRPDVLDASRTSPTAFRLVVDDAAVALPNIVEGLTSGGVEVKSAREDRPSFEEVFGTLVRRSRGEPEPVAAPEVARGEERAA